VLTSIAVSYLKPFNVQNQNSKASCEPIMTGIEPQHNLGEERDDTFIKCEIWKS